MLYRLAESDLRTVVELDPRNAKGWWALSMLLRRKGSFAEAKVAARNALQADAFLDVPVEALFALYQTSLDQEEVAEARDWCAWIHEMHPESMRWVQCELQLMASDGLPPDVDRSWALVDSIGARSEEERASILRAWATIYVAKVLALNGMADSSRAVLEAVVPEPPPEWASYDAAHAYLMLGDYDRALEMLEYRVRQAPSQAGSLASDWWFRPLHGDPRLERLIRVATEAGAPAR